MIVINRFKLIALILFLSLLPVFPVFADEQVVVQDQNQVKIVVFKLNDYNYYVEDANGNVKAVAMDVTPYVESGRTFVPVRYLGNALGLSDDSIKWDQASRTATLKGKRALALTLGSKIMKSDNETREMDVAPGVKPPGRTMLPARYVAEGLGYTVEWDEKNQIVVCYPQGEPKPDLTKILEVIKQNSVPVITKGTGNTQISIRALPGFFDPVSNAPGATIHCGYFDMLSDGSVKIGIPTNLLFYTKEQIQQYANEAIRALVAKYGSAIENQLRDAMDRAVYASLDQTGLVEHYHKDIPIPGKKVELRINSGGSGYWLEIWVANVN